MAFTVESKSQLAKLLATENLTIEHQKLTTARFDPKNRVLYCPIWQDMSGALYDLLMGHEVGHALYTPAEGWHDAVSSYGRKFKGFLNVVEDARIEKKVKRKFPGIRASFTKGYQSLIDRDFFGLKSRDINTLSFIDRLNIYTKIGNLAKVDFSDKELVMLRQVEACETWEDVLLVTRTIFNYSKNEQFETMQQALASLVESQSGQNDEEDGEEYETSDSDYDGSSEEDGDGDYFQEEDTDTDGSGEEKETKQAKQNADSNGQESDGQDENTGDETGSIVNRDKESQASNYDQFEPSCETDENFRKNETSLLSAESKNYVYGKIPKPNLDAIVTPAKRVQQLLNEYYFKQSEGFAKQYTEKVKEFKSKNDRYIGLLAKEFEMKKAAKAYAKAKVSNTGDIDINRLYKYQVEDNIFKKMMRIPKGKSHGLVLLLDRSGSMSRNMAGSIEQILVLTMFCRKVNIPFVVYGFGDSTESRIIDFPKQPIEKSFTPDVNELAFETVFLREYLNSKMSNVEFNSSIRNMIALRDSYSENARGRWGIGRPASEHLGNTPLIQAVVALEPITQQFRKVNNLDLVNLVVVHDGDADRSDMVMQERESYGWENKPGQMTVRPHTFNPKVDNVYIKDRDSKLQIKVESYINDSYYTTEEGLRIGVFDWYKAKTGAKIFGFFITGTGREMRAGIANKYINKEGKTVREQVYKADVNARYYQIDKSEYVKGLSKNLQSEKFLESYNKGYDSFFILPGGNDLQIEDEELVVNGVVTASKLKTAFMKMNKKKAVNRVMVSRFIDGIAS